MFLLRKPSEATIRQLIAGQHELAFSYPAVGATAGTPPGGYNVDHNRVRLGAGAETFARAVAAVRRWEMFPREWTQLCWPNAPIEIGTTVGLLVPLPGLWMFGACRIVYLVDEDGLVQRFGFAYGTLPTHVERGEERFTVEWRREDDSVWYDILAFSQPNHILVWAGYPIARLMQRRFARDSKRAMVAAAAPPPIA
jgi:uncharacterized protein (UPF0548 family)